MFYFLGHAIRVDFLPAFPASDFLYTVSVWILILILYQIVLFVIRKTIIFRSKTEIDDIVLSVARTPMRLLIIVYGLRDAIYASHMASTWKSRIDVAVRLAIIVVVTVLVWQILFAVVLKIAQEKAEESRNEVDDAIVPIMSVFGKLVVAIAAVLYILHVVGVNFNTLLGVLGGLSFLLIFLFQEPLSNLFSGVYLWIDNPFKTGDLLITEDGTTYQVQHIGARVSKLYNLNDHTVAHIPNNNLATQRLINLTQPNTELKQSVSIGVSYDTPVGKVEEVLLDIAYAHPHILGAWPVKRSTMERWLKEGWFPPGHAGWYMVQMRRLEAEYRARELGEKVRKELVFLSRYITEVEERGLDEEERYIVEKMAYHILGQVNDLRKWYTVWFAAKAFLAAHYGRKEDVVPEDFYAVEERIKNKDITWIAEPDADMNDPIDALWYSGLIPVFRDLVRSARDLNPIDIQSLAAHWEKTFPTYTLQYDLQEEYKRWFYNLRSLQTEIARFTDFSDLPIEEQTQLDSRVMELADWIKQEFLLPPQMWQEPSVSFVNHGASSLDFSLDFFVDDLSGDHFLRAGDVVSDIRMWITERFDQEGIEIPFPQHDVHIRESNIKI